MKSEAGAPKLELPRRHELLAVSADCTIAATFFYAASVHLIQIPIRPAAVVAALSAAAVWLLLVRLVLKGAFRPKAGTLLYASTGTVGCVTVAVGLFAVYSLRAGPAAAAYLPMIATVCGALLTRSAARNVTAQ